MAQQSQSQLLPNSFGDGRGRHGSEVAIGKSSGDQGTLSVYVDVAVTAPTDLDPVGPGRAAAVCTPGLSSPDLDVNLRP